MSDGVIVMVAVFAAYVFGMFQGARMTYRELETKKPPARGRGLDR